ncbi:hypothetical protein MTO96_035811 [Rhipicephalus appendiculatus]
MLSKSESLEFVLITPDMDGAGCGDRAMLWNDPVSLKMAESVNSLLTVRVALGSSSALYKVEGTCDVERDAEIFGQACESPRASRFDCGGYKFWFETKHDLDQLAEYNKKHGLEGCVLLDVHDGVVVDVALHRDLSRFKCA